MARGAAAMERLSGEGEVTSKLTSMLNVSDGSSETSGAAVSKKKIVEMSDDGGFDLSSAVEEEPEVRPPPPPGGSLMDDLMADATEAATEKTEKKTTEEKRMKSSFGNGMKKGFFSSKESSKKKAQPKPKKPKEEVVEVKKKKAEDGGVAAAIQREVAENLKANQHPMAQKLSGGEWVTPELLERLKSNPMLEKKMNDPRCQAALQAWQQTLAKDPKKAETMFEADPELRSFVMEFASLMGGHFDKLGKEEANGKEAGKKGEAPKEISQAAMGPMATKIAKDTAEGKGPKPATTPEEKAQVEAVLSDGQLRELLMDPATQELMQRCGQPAAFAEAMRDPKNREIIKRLEKAGLVQLA